ncbi:hypothetical protein IscW_ISCW020368 [Ixodes scapularis]|uniref:Uncharacterized protein n=1 Tax=Ixodes scapularis TaxID=6945 RepID=B7Q1T2_IXOSC|nr:hypothetical protein IscW_ISCW020368 [Ixodes scapularis]|eukprot:XP_002410092.1 hypothetical protein IscW_ISCW020368 [Ixodes scapularis]
MTTPRKTNNVKCIVCIILFGSVSLVLPGWLLEYRHQHLTHPASVSTEPHIGRVWRRRRWRGEKKKEGKGGEHRRSERGRREQRGDDRRFDATRFPYRALLKLHVVCYEPTSFRAQLLGARFRLERRRRRRNCAVHYG